MFGFFKKKKDLPKRTIIKTTKNGFQKSLFLLKIKDKELDVFREVFKRSNITFIVK